jgi:hypothetical protein
MLKKESLVSVAEAAERRCSWQETGCKYSQAVLGMMLLIMTALYPVLVTDSVAAQNNRISDEEIAQEIVSPVNKPIIEAFLKYELGEVNEQVTKPLLADHPSLVFFIKQAKRGPLDSLLFLEDQVHKLRDAQKNIDSLPYSMLFSAGEKKKLLGLRAVADRIVSFGIPLMKRDFYSVVVAAGSIAKAKGKDPVTLMPDPKFRDDIYRTAVSSAKGLDAEMGELSYGELVCMQLGWVLEQVTVTNLWMMVQDNKLPQQKDFAVYRKQRSEYFQQRLKRIYGDQALGPVKK